MNEKIKVKVSDEGDHYISIEVNENSKIKLDENDAANISAAISEKFTYNGKGWKFGYAAEADGKPERFGFVKGNAGMTVLIPESRVLKVFFDEYVKMVIGDKIAQDVKESITSIE